MLHETIRLFLTRIVAISGCKYAIIMMENGYPASSVCMYFVMQSSCTTNTFPQRTIFHRHKKAGSILNLEKFVVKYAVLVH